MLRRFNPRLQPSAGAAAFNSVVVDISKAGEVQLHVPELEEVRGDVKLNLRWTGTEA